LLMEGFLALVAGEMRFRLAPTLSGVPVISAKKGCDRAS